MKTHINFLQQLPSITLLLATRSLFSFEGEYQDYANEDGIRVVDAEDSASTRIVVLKGFEKPVLTAVETDGDLLLFASHDLPRMTGLCAVLSAMGLQAVDTDDGYKLNVSFTKEELSTGGLELPRIEALWNRILSLDSLWMANRRLCQFDNDLVRVTGNLIKIFDKAHAWDTRRLIDFQGDTRKVDANATQKVIEDLGSAAQWGVPGLLGLRIHDDPRGSAFELQFEGNYSLGVTSLRLPWPASPLFACNKALKRITTSSSKYAIRPTKIAAEVRAVLDGLIVEGTTVRIVHRLGKALYAKVNETLNTIGGKWHPGAQAHIFDDDPRDLIAEMVATGTVYTRKDFEFFATPTELVHKVISYADMEFGMKMLEPSAGRGALAIPGAAIVGMVNVTCFELMDRNVSHLQAAGFAVSAPQDFLDIPAKPAFDRIVMNPPFSFGRDAAHIRHAYGFLKAGGRLVSIASTQWQTHSTAPARAFQAFLDKSNAKVEQIDAGAFHESGTDVATTLIVLCKSNASQASKAFVEQADLF